MKKIFLLLVFSLVFGCSLKEQSLNSIIEESYKECEHKNNCVIDLNKVLNFEWDNLYYFSEGVTNEAVSKAIGFNYTKDKDLSRLIIFTKEKKIVYEQKELVNYDRPFKIDFLNPESRYYPSNAKFRIEKSDGRNLYTLIHLE